MKICIVADGRSPIARDWIRYFTARHEVHVLSTFPCDREAIPGATIHCLGASAAHPAAPHSPFREAARRRLRAFQWSSGLHDSVAQPLKAAWLARPAARLVARIRPDLLHSLRLPIEGYVGAGTGFTPHLISAWGNDFTLYADRYWLHERLTRQAVSNAAGFLADARADIERARGRYGLPASVPDLCVPGAGGVDRLLFAPPDGARAERLIVNPRGFRRYVRNDTFFAACRIVASRLPDVRFTGVAMRGWPVLEQMVRQLDLESRVTLTPPLSRPELAALYRRAPVTVSPTEHDGTPNTLLEAMSAGCLPVCGDLPSIREWITHGENGLLTSAGDPAQLAAAMIRALEDRDLQIRARLMNPARIAERADYRHSMEQAEGFYERIVAASRTAVTVPDLPATLKETAAR